jgi:ADP-ribose pyrophosphatase YjhB (NUDIX family)
MTTLLDNPRFADAYAQLAKVSLNPRRHTAANARAHSEAVATRAGLLARQNGCTAAEAQLLEDLGRVHDIGKITGTARPERSLEVLADCGVGDPQLLGLVKWHDTNLPWFNAHSRGQPPTDKAWRRLAAEVDVRLLALFMVADRVDAPPGWRRNAPLVWFLDQARTRGLVGELSLDIPGQPSEVSAGAALVDGDRVLVIRVRAEGYELPKGGVEWDELPDEAALRELREEAGVTSMLVAGRTLGHLDYAVATHDKRVYYVAATSPAVEMGPQPSRTRERRWVTRDEVATLPLVNEQLRSLLVAALS